MNLAEVKKLKVTELRAELQERGLDTKGLKADLVGRLVSAIEAESQTALPVEVGDNEGPHGDMVQQQQDDRALELSTPAVEMVVGTNRLLPTGEVEVTHEVDAEVDRKDLAQVTLCEAPITSPSETKQPASPKLPAAVELATDHPTLPVLTRENKNAVPVLVTTPSSLSETVQMEDAAAAAAKPVPFGEAPSLSLTKEVLRKEESVLSSGSAIGQAKIDQRKPQTHHKNTEESPEYLASGVNDKASESGTVMPVAPAKIALPHAKPEEETLTTVTSKQEPTNEAKPTTSTSSTVSKKEAKKDDLNGSTRMQSHAGSTSDNGAEPDWTMIGERGSDEETGSEPEKEGQPVSKGSEVEGKEDEGERRGVKRPRVERGRGYYEFKEEINYNRAKSPEPEPEVEDEEEVDNGLLRLDSYNSDLHFEVGQDGCSGQPLFSEKFPLLWSGCRLTHGVNQGRVGIEAKFVKKLPVTDLKVEDPDTHVLRVGWSVDNSSFQLGKEELSYCYDGRGRKVTGGKEEEFGEPFSEGDVIGCYASFSDSEVELSFYKNGSPEGTAFSVSLAVLAGQALHPHVLCRNVCVALNLDPAGLPWFPGPPEHTPFPALPPELQVRAILPPVSKQQCEVLMMVGMPGAGKTHWAQAHMAKNPEKRYNLLSTQSVLSCMTYVPEPGQEEQVIQQATQCVSQLIKVAARRRRNYILDQANVYASAQRRKLLRFRGFQRKAVVICPTDEEWKRRLAMHQKEEAEEVPDMSLLKVKVSFTLPEQGDYLEEVLFLEMSREETEKLLTGYKEEARRLLPSRPKRKKHRNPRRNKPPPNAPNHPGRNLRDWGYGGNRGGYSQRPYGHQPYWGQQRREDYRPFYNQYRNEYDPFYSRNYDPQRYRDYFRQYTGEWNQSYQDQGHYGNRNYGYGSYRGYR
ncbi:hypothetical protein AAFF_G00321390 [Aldrovandia affinis]|uniref:Uncharacterized protein n=1 Tax=Aldrovandia affinis TaxID=143900 RepID=A0AAD7WQD8_9TELE|nr:hypothetical protein AAFF_G00321390 [Aldrovandia affinis]